ncbi:hypothetical protein ACE6H2_001149 [Prunus campanulata]
MACSSFKAVISCCCRCFKCEETHQPVKVPQPPPKNYDSPKPTVVDPRAGMNFNIHGNEISNNKADDVGLSHFGNKKNGGPNANNQDGGAHSAKQGGGDKLHFNLEGDSEKVCFNLEGNKIHGNQAKIVGFSEFGNA